MEIERISITPERIWVKDANGNYKFDTDFKYLKTVSIGGNLKLTQLAAAPVPQYGTTTLASNGGHPLTFTFNPVTHTNPSNPGYNESRTLLEPKVTGTLSFRPCIMATANDATPGTPTTIASAAVAFAVISTGYQSVTFYYSTINTSNGVVAYMAHSNFLQGSGVNTPSQATGFNVQCGPGGTVVFYSVRNTNGVNFDFTLRPLITLYARWYSDVSTLPLARTS